MSVASLLLKRPFKCRTVDKLDIFGDGSGKVLYRLDGNANDESGNYHGTETAITYGGGVYERGAVFNGSTSSILTSYSTSSSSAVSVSLWFKASTIRSTDDNNLAIIINSTNSHQYAIACKNSNTLYFGCYNGSLNLITYTVSLNTWYHVVLTDTGTSLSAYVNGTQVGTSVSHTNPTLGTNYWTLGDAYATNAITGSIDQVRIFNRAITATEVATLYAECAPTSTVDNINPFKDGSLKALYQFNGDATDKTGVYNGTATNVTYATGKLGQCAVFNGASLVSTSFSLSANVFSYSGWVKITTPSSTIQSIVDFTTNRAMLSSGNGTNAYLSYYDGGTYRTFSAYTLPSNTFVFISLVVNGTTAYLYADGVLKGTSACTSIIPSGGMYIGRYAGSAGGFLTGSIDQLRLFNKALTPMEIASLYCETTPLEEPLSTLVDPFKDGNGKALYRLEGNALDESGNYNGTTSNVTYAGSFLLGARCGVFNGSSSGISIPVIPTSDSPISISAWVKPAATKDQCVIEYGRTQSGNGAFRVLLNASGQVQVQSYNGANTTTSTTQQVYSTGVWMHIVAVYSGGNIMIYWNGTLVKTTAVVYTYVINTATASIGKDVLNTLYFNGSIDQVRTFNRGLTSTEAQSIYTAGA